MAHVELLPEAVLDRVARQLGGMLPALDPSLADVPVGLAESFPVWLLRQPHDGETLEVLAIPTTQWHHQIRTEDGRAVAFARSSHPPVHEDDDAPGLMRNDIASWLNHAIEWIDEYVPGDPETRLLVAPAYHLHAFWLVGDGGSSVVVSDFPEGGLALQRERLYSEAEFLRALRLAEPITGVRGMFEAADAE
jgi:hypothetical protein